MSTAIAETEIVEQAVIGHDRFSFERPSPLPHHPARHNRMLKWEHLTNFGAVIPEFTVHVRPLLYLGVTYQTGDVFFPDIHPKLRVQLFHRLYEQRRIVPIAGFVPPQRFTKSTNPAKPLVVERVTSIAHTKDHPHSLVLQLKMALRNFVAAGIGLEQMPVLPVLPVMPLESESVNVEEEDVELDSTADNSPVIPSEDPQPARTTSPQDPSVASKDAAVSNKPVSRLGSRRIRRP